MIIVIFRFEYGNEIIYQHQLNTEDEGPAIDLHFNDNGSDSPMLVYATGFGSIVGWDLRQPGPRSKLKGGGAKAPAFKLQNDLRDGIQTTMAISADQVLILY